MLRSWLQVYSVLKSKWRWESKIIHETNITLSLHFQPHSLYLSCMRPVASGSGGSWGSAGQICSILFWNAPLRSCFLHFPSSVTFPSQFSSSIIGWNNLLILFLYGYIFLFLYHFNEVLGKRESVLLKSPLQPEAH